MDERRLFSLEEANDLVPLLEARLARAMQIRARLQEAHELLVGLGEPPTPDSLHRDDGDPGLVRARARFRGLMDDLARALRVIEETGVAIKDLDAGLCDFPGHLEGREVWFCWQLGEKEVAFWHDLDTGFAGRRPLDESGRAPEPLLH